MSVNYKKLYSYLVGQIDDALTLLDAENIFQYYRVKRYFRKRVANRRGDVFGRGGR